MKNQIIKVAAVMAFLTMALGARAQGDKTWSIGPEIGVNFSKYGKDAPDNDFRTGPLGGVFATYSVNKAYAFTGKVLYSQKGPQSTTAGTNYKIALHYIEVPLIARFFMVQEGAFRPNVFVGPSFAFLAGASSKVNDGDWVKSTNYKDNLNGFDFGVTAGLGFNYEIAEDTRILIDARYTHGLSDVIKSSAANYNNMAIGITAGVSFGIN